MVLFPAFWVSENKADKKPSHKRNWPYHGTYLPAIFDHLREDAIVISDAVAIGCQTQGGHGVQEAGSKTTKSTVAQASILLDIFQLLDVKAKLHKMQWTNKAR